MGRFGNRVASAQSSSKINPPCEVQTLVVADDSAETGRLMCLDEAEMGGAHRRAHE